MKMDTKLETRIKDFSIFAGFFLALFVLFSVFGDVSRLLSLTTINFPIDNNTNLMIAAFAALGVIVGFLVFYFIPQFIEKKYWKMNIVLVFLLSGLGGLGYAFTPFACFFTGWAGFGLLTFITPTKIAEWSQFLFGPGKNKKFSVSIAVAASCAYFSMIQLTDATILNTAIFSVGLILLGIGWFVWLYFGNRFHSQITTYKLEEPIISQKVTISKYLVNLVVMIGWNFLFLTLVEYWYTNTNPGVFSEYWSSASSPGSKYPGFLNLAFPNILGFLIAATCIGVGLMLVTEVVLKNNQMRRQWLYLECLIAFFVVTGLYFFNSANPVNPINTPNFIYMILSVLALPVVIGGVFQGSPFPFKNKIFELLQNFFILIDLAFIVIAGTLIPGLFAQFGSAKNTIFPTVYLVNIIFLGIMFLFNILRLSIVDESILTETTIELKDDAKLQNNNNS